MPNALFLLWACVSDLSGSAPERSIATVLEASCMYADAWLDHAGAVVMEEQRGFDADGRPLWHTVDGELQISWSYDADGRPLAMQQGDPLDPDLEHVYTWDEEGRLAQVTVGGDVVRLTWGDDGLLVRGVTDAEGQLAQSTRWIWDDDGALLAWSVERDGFRVLEAERETFEDGRSYRELQTDLSSGAWLEIVEVIDADGAPSSRSLSTETVQSTRSWERLDDGWRLQTSFGTQPKDTLDDEVRYTFDALGRELSREVSGEGASPFVRRDRSWSCEGPVQDAFQPPLYEERSLFYVSPLYVDPPWP